MGGGIEIWDLGFVLDLVVFGFGIWDFVIWISSVIDYRLLTMDYGLF